MRSASLSAVRSGCCSSDWLSTCALTYITRRGPLPSPTQPVMRLSSSPGRASSTGMSKIVDRAPVVGASCRAATMADPTCWPVRSPPMPTVVFDARDALRPPLRGWGRHVRELGRALAAVGAPVRVLNGRWPGPEVVWEQVGLPASALARHDAVIHAPNCFLPLIRPCPGVVTVHDLAFEVFPHDFATATRWKYRVLARAAARSAERVICVSQATADDVAVRWRVPAKRLRVVPNAPALPIGDAPAPAGDYILGIGDLRAKKAWDVLVDAWRRSGVEHRLVIAGADAGEGARLRALGGERLELPGYLDDARLDALLRGAAALAHPSPYEGFGLAVAEAMARGVPIVCADAGALPETAGGAAALFAPGDADALAQALRDVLADREGWARRARERSSAFSWERTARLTWDVYAELL